MTPERTDRQSDAPEPAPDQAQKRKTTALSRRALITGGTMLGVGVAAAAIAATRPGSGSSAATGQATPSASSTAQPVLRSFVSSDLTVPAITSWKTGTTAPGFVFVTQQVTGFNGAIVRENGEPVWIEPTKANVTDLKVQTYRGEPVLTYWTGKSTGGHGAGQGKILDPTYATIATVSAGNGLDADLHEFNLTDRGTALVTVYATKPADLSSIGGPKNGYLYDCHVQEIDVETGKVLLDWDALDHIPVSETYLGLTQDAGHDGTTAGRAFDAYHLNAVEEDGDRLLVSARHTHTIYSIDRATGDVKWRFGGKKSDIAVQKDAVFAWQHDVRRHDDGTITLFDNHLYSGTDGASRGLKFSLDTGETTATLEQEYRYDNHLGTAMGSVQVLQNGNVLVGWGTDPAVTEFTAAGDAVYEATLGAISYRASRHAWVAHPTTAPSVAVRSEGDGMRVFASWNGATEVRSWRVLASTSGEPAPVGTVKRSGFETSLLVKQAQHVAVQALDANGEVLAASKTISV
ncbi:arylsulfotransferase family protein [Leifsonia sp. NPDC102414]|uniref:arylsulfotransferase family protein n=1 Tax=Leifsonia sp. NPDC102414 TaxID=3364124 RepID=UPI003803EE36